MSNPDVVIVGGGPVGLWVAIQIKRWRPDFNIVILEKSIDYHRNHILRLESITTQLYTNPSHKSKAYRAAYDRFYQQIGGTHTLNLPTNELEAALKSYAHQLDINIKYWHPLEPTEPEEWFANTKYFVAADGARSNMRAGLFGPDDKCLNLQTMQYCVELKYKVQGQAKPLDLLTEQWSLNSSLTSMATEHIGRQSNGETGITVRFFVDRQTYDGLPACGFKNPLQINDDRIPPALAKDIDSYLVAREAKTNEQILLGSLKLTKLPLQIYRAKQFSTQHNGRWWFLVGDAAMGLPYFRSLNSGMVVGSQLAAILAQTLLNGQAKSLAYEAVKLPDSAVESMAAQAKNLGINLLNKLRRLRWGR